MLLSNFVNELAVSAGVQVDILKTVVALLTSFLLSNSFLTQVHSLDSHPHHFSEIVLVSQ